MTVLRSVFALAAFQGWALARRFAYHAFLMLRRQGDDVRSVLITGTSTGIGLVTSVELAARGWRVFATMRDTNKASALEEALRAKPVRGSVEIGQLDVTDQASIDSAVARTLEATGGSLDAVVHNAGISVAGAFEDLSKDQIQRVMETNFFGVLSLTQAVLPAMRAQRRGTILTVTSEAAFFGFPANSMYSASKWAIEGWSESIAYELDAFGIDVVLVEPGPYRTDIWKTTERVLPHGSAYRPLMTHLYKQGDQHSAAQAGDPVDVARAIARVVDSNKPRFRTAVGPLSTLLHFCRGKVPSRLLRRVVQRIYGLHLIRL